MSEPTNRVPAGVPTGGQFAATARSESGLRLVETWTRPAGWRDWWPEPVGEGRIDAESWSAAAQESGWVEAWNATPREQRRPLELVHGSDQADLTLDGRAHFGDRGAAMDRLYNTMEDVTDGHLHIYEYRGDIVPLVMPDTVANLIIHPDKPYRDSFYDLLGEEVADIGYEDPAAFVEEAESAVMAMPDAAISYVNNTEGSFDGPTASLAIHAHSEHLVHVTTRPVTDEDCEHIAY